MMQKVSGILEVKGVSRRWDGASHSTSPPLVLTTVQISAKDEDDLHSLNTISRSPPHVSEANANFAVAAS